MSILGAMNTAISGLTGQSAALSNISDDIANSQTTGFKRIDTSFQDFLTSSSAVQNVSGSIVAVPQYINSVQGTVTQTDNPLALAISGQGFFQVSQPIGTSDGSLQFAPDPRYTRAGDFQLDNNGYLVNSDGNYLNGWVAQPSTTPTTAPWPLDKNTTISPVQVTPALRAYAPVQTGNVDLSANLPAGGTNTITTNVNIYDAQGTAHQLTLAFVPTPSTGGTPSNSWTLNVTDDNKNVLAPSPQTVTFNTDGSLASPTSIPLVTSYATPFTSTGTAGVQSINLNFGSIKGSAGLTQVAGTRYAQGNLTQDGAAPGNFSTVTTNSSGNIIVNYDNGESRTIAQAPVVTFTAPDQLQRQNGSAFTATVASGGAVARDPGANGAGTLVTSSIELSNVDLATQFSRLIVAQQSYSANAKMVTTANQMMQTSLDMKQ